MDKNLEQHFNQEIEMACSQLYNAAMDAAKLHDMVKDVDHLEAWQQSKITKASDYLTSVLKSLGHDIAMDNMGIDHNAMTDRALDDENAITNTDSLEYYVNEGICPHCNGEMVSEQAFMEAKKDACYHKVKSRYKIWPSAYACVPEKTSKALTKNGWKSVNELNVDDEIMTYNMSLDILEFKPIINIHRYKNVETNVIKSGNTGFMFESTPNHKWVVKLPEQKSNRTSKYEKINNMTLMETSEILNLKNNKNLVVSAEYNGGMPIKKNKIFKYGDNWLNYIIEITPEQRQTWIFSAIVYDGNQIKTQRLTENTGETSQLDWEYSGNHGKQAFGFKQKDIQHRDAFLLAAFLNGGTVTWKKHNSREIHSCYYVSNKRHKNMSNFNIIKSNFTDVWCPETENNTWVMMQETDGNGIITITGNSGALVKCRKVGAKNWGNKSNESMEEVDESLRDWFSKGGEGGAGGGGWDRYNTKGERIGKCGERKAGEGKPKCLSKEKAASLRSSGGKKAIAAAVRKKRREDPNPERKGKADMVSNKTKNESMVTDVFGVKEFDKLNSMLEKYKTLYTQAMGEAPLDLSKINKYHEKMLELVQLLQKMKAKSIPVKETDVDTCETQEDTYESRFENKLKSFLEGSMGGINRSRPAADVSYEKVLDTSYETDQEKHKEKKKMHRKGQEFAKKIAMDKEEISYDEKLNEYLNSSEIFNEDYAEESPQSIILEDLSLEVIGNKNSKYISEDEITVHCDEICGILEEDEIVEAEYQGRKVQLNKPIRSSGGPKKFHVFVKDPKTGNVKKVNFGDPNMKIKKSNPQRRKSFRARHNCDNPGPKTKARYWSCRKW